MAKKPRKPKPKSVMHTDLKDLELSRALRRLSNVRVTEWEFRDILPKVKEIAAKEVDPVDLLKRTANFRVNDWEFTETLPNVKELASSEVDVLNFFKRTANIRVNDWEIGGGRISETGQLQRPTPPSAEEAQTHIRKLSEFLGFVTRNLIEEPDKAVIMVSTPSPSEIRFRLVLTSRDSAALIGHGGHTAAAIRNLIKDAGSRSRFFVDLKILSHEEEKELQISHPTRAKWKKVKPSAPLLH